MSIAHVAGRSRSATFQAATFRTNPRWFPIRSDAPIVIRYTRLDARRPEVALPSTIAFSET